MPGLDDLPLTDTPDGISPPLPRPLTGLDEPSTPPGPPPVADDPWLPGSGAPTPAPAVPAPSLPEEPAQPPALPAEGDPAFPGPPAGIGEPVFERPANAPAPAAPPVEVEAPPVPFTAPSPAPFEFTPPDQKRAQAHADRLRATPTDATLKGYPADLVTRARPDLALEPGTRPVLLLFYDNGARASNLQAAELLPLLVRLREAVDVIPIDVGASSTLSAAEKKLVRTYYMAYVPTTVVLGANRKPILLQYQRVSAAVVEAALSAPPR